MIKQFINFTSANSKNILFIPSKNLFEYNIVHTLNIFLHTTIKHFPIKYVTQQTNINDVTTHDITLFEKYKDQINYINNYSENCN
jgi:hypothetical protein